MPPSGWLSQGLPAGQWLVAVWLNRGVVPRGVPEVGMPIVAFLHRTRIGDSIMIIGVDPHKSSHTATAVDPATNTPVASLRIDASLAGYRQLHR